MQKTIHVFLLLSITSFWVCAQKPPIKFGDIPMDQVTMKKYAKDSSAEAVILADYGQTSITYYQNTGWKLNFERIRRIKILTREGLKWADFQIPVYHDGSDEEKVTGLKGATYNLENGKIVASKLKNDAIFKEKDDANWTNVKLTLPNAKEGSVVEVAYTITSDFISNFQDWDFQSTIPVIWSEYRSTVPEYFTFDRYMQGYIPLAVNEQSEQAGSISITTAERGEGKNPGPTEFSNDKIEFKEAKSRWVSQNVPAFKEEPNMTTYRDYISRMNFELMSMQFPNQPPKYYVGTWESINTTFLESEWFGGVISGSGFLKKLVDEAIAGKTSPSERVAAIYAYVKSNMEWDGLYRRTAHDGLKKAWDAKKGNSAEINLVLTSMLQKAELKADPVLISTRNHGFVREQIAISTQFNYVICAVQVDGKTLLLDATDPYLPINILPERCLNGQGFLISKETSGWVKIGGNFKSRTVTNLDLVLNTEGQLTGKANFTRDGYDAQDMRKRYVSKGEAEYFKTLAGLGNWELRKSEIENVKKITEPLKENHDVTIAEYTQSSGGIIYLNPIIIYRKTENPFKSEKRQYPVDFGSASEELYLAKITIPEGYRVEELPKAKVIALPGGAGKYVYNLVQVGNIINVTSQLAISRSLFVQDEYPTLREFYNQVVGKQAEQIVLKKN